MSTWPHLLVEEGPRLAGIAAGDAFALAPDHVVLVSALAWGRAMRGPA